MLLSSSTTINMLAFYLTSAVILDTFVVRTVLVPAMMYTLGTYNWWPKQYPDNSPLLLAESPGAE